MRQVLLCGLVRGLAAAALLLSAPVGWHIGQGIANATSTPPDEMVLNIR